MSRTSQLMSIDDRYNYMLDKVVFVLTTDFIPYSPPRKLYFNKKGQADLTQDKSDGYVKKCPPSGYKGTRYITLNGNRTAKANLYSQIPNSNTLVRSRYNHGDNFIPCGFRKWVKDNSSMSEVRDQVISGWFFDLQNSKKIFAEQVAATFGMEYNVKDVNVTLQYCEVCYDLVHPTGTQINRIPKVIKGFNHAADSVDVGFFKPNGAFRVRERISSVTRTTSFSNTDALRARINEDGAWVEYFSYQKEDGQYGALNRCESRFNQTALENIFGARSFFNQKDLKKMIDRLSEISFKRYYSILNFSPKNKKRKWKLLRKLLRTVMPTSADDVWDLLRNHGRISTAKDCNRTPKSAKRRIPMLAKFEIIFTKRKGSIYKVNWASLPFTDERFYLFKKAQIKQIKHQTTKDQNSQKRTDIKKSDEVILH